MRDVAYDPMAPVIHPALASNSALRRLFRDGGARINGEVVSEDRIVTEADLDQDGALKLSIGRKTHLIVRAV